MPKKADVESKIALLLRFLLFKSHRYPGVKGWELERKFGKNFPRYIEALNLILEKFSLTIQMIPPEDVENKTPIEGLRATRFVIVAKPPISMTEAKLCGWSIDELACLSASIAYIIANGGSIQRTKLQEFLAEKLPNWHVKASLKKFTRDGYLTLEEDVFKIGWRTYAELDLEEFTQKLLEIGLNADESREPSG